VTGGKKSAGKPKKNWVYGSWAEKGKKLNHLAEINLVLFLCQGEIEPLLFLFF
jgi:hypothetical protein